MRSVLTFILAGGKGERLDPLTRDRAKPAVPFGGIYRIIDFTLSNCVNSGLRRIYVLIQYKSFSLQKHLLSGWDVVSNQLGEFIDAIPPQQRISSDWYRGTADAIYQNIYAIRDHEPEDVLILSGDHIYKMNYEKLIAHHRKTKADVTVSCIEVDKKESPQFGVIEVSKSGRITGFQEKPLKPKTIPGKKQKIFASMGVYLFKKEVLIDQLKKDAREDSDHDFGRNIIPQMIKDRKKLFVYNFIDKKGRPCYWRDVGTRDAYYQANMDLVRLNPPFDLYDRSWPVRTFHEQYPPIKMLSVHHKGKVFDSAVIDSMIAGGCLIKGAHIERSVISSHVTVNQKSQIFDSILMEGVEVGRHAKIRNAIIDKQVKIPAYSEIGYHTAQDKRQFALTTSGIVIVAKKTAVKSIT